METKVILIRFDNGKTRRLPYDLVAWARLTSAMNPPDIYPPTDNLDNTLVIDMTKVTMIEVVNDTRIEHEGI